MTNYSTAVMLFNPKIRAINIFYNPIEKDPSQSSFTFKSLDPTIETDDLVVIPTDTRHGFTVVKVAEVDVEVDIESDTQLKWIASKLDTRANDAVLLEEGKWIAQMKKGEARKRREEIKKNMEDLYTDEEGALDTLPIASMDSDVLLLESTSTVAPIAEVEAEEEDAE